MECKLFSNVNYLKIKKMNNREKSLECHFLISKLMIICYNNMRNIGNEKYVYNEVSGMAVSYKKLFKMLIDRDMKKKDLRALTGISSNTITKLANNENVTMEVIEKICLGMGCTINEVVDFIPGDQVDADIDKKGE